MADGVLVKRITDGHPLSRAMAPSAHPPGGDARSRTQIAGASSTEAARRLQDSRHGFVRQRFSVEACSSAPLWQPHLTQSRCWLGSRVVSASARSFRGAWTVLCTYGLQ